MTDEELAVKLEELKATKECDNISFLSLSNQWLQGTHPFMIGLGHMKSDSMYLDVNAHGCYWKGQDRRQCGLPYDDPTHKPVVTLMVDIGEKLTKTEWKRFVKQIKAQSGWLDGIGLKSGEDILRALLSPI